jgi:tellurite methyltransferase
VPPESQPADVAPYFDALYSGEERYWWREGDPYSTEANAYPTSLLTQMTLHLLAGIDPEGRRVLDLGAGEGADSIRLAKLGYDVTAVEISEVAVKKIERFAAEARADINIELADIREYQPTGAFDVVICNGVLHYIRDKVTVIHRMQAATAPGGLNVVSLWSTSTTVPECHNSVPVYCDEEDGVVSGAYRSWDLSLLYFERGKPETSHSGMPQHAHSHIKLIAKKLHTHSA